MQLQVVKRRDAELKGNLNAIWRVSPSGDKKERKEAEDKDVKRQVMGGCKPRAAKRGQPSAETEVRGSAHTLISDLWVYRSGDPEVDSHPFRELFHQPQKQKCTLPGVSLPNDFSSSGKRSQAGPEL